MRKIMILALLVLMLGAALPAQAAIRWECIIDFTQTDGGFTARRGVSLYGSWSSGWETTDGLYLGIYRRGIDITYALSGSTITDVDVKYDLTKGTYSGSPTIALFVIVGSTFVISENDTDLSNGSNQSSSWTGSISGGSSVVLGLNSSVRNSAVYDGSAAITRLIIGGSGTVAFAEGTGIDCNVVDGYVRPLAAEDVHLDIQSYGSGILQAQNSVIALSKAPGAHVHAGVSGLITEVRRMNMNDCAYYLQSAFVQTPVQVVCWVLIEDGAYLLPGGGLNLQVDVVKIEGVAGVRLQYLVANAEAYVRQGQSVSAGCWLGETFRYEAVGPDVSVGAGGPSASVSAVDITKGMMVVAREDGGTLIPSIDDFTEEPLDTAPCNAPEGYENCLGDANLVNLSQWVTLNANPRNPGVDVMPGGYIKTEMNLSQTREPGLKVSVRSVGSTGSVQLTLGQTVSSFTVGSSRDPQTISIPPDEHLPDTSFYTIKVANLGDSTLNVRFICVQMSYDSEGSPTETPPDGPEDTPNDDNSRCKLADYSFDNPSGVWSLSSGETAPGEIRLPHNAIAGQSVAISAGTYSVSVVAAIWHYSTYTPNETEADAVTIEYDYPAGAGYTTVESKTFGDFATDNNLLVFSGTLTLGSNSSGMFNLRPVLSDVPTGVRGVIIRSICIGSDSGGGGSGGGGSSGSDWEGPFETSCGQISQPTGSIDVGSWTRWLWARFNQFHQCDLMVLLNGLHNTVQRFMLLVAWSIRWGHELASRGVMWFSRDFTFWLGGQIANMGGATLTVGDNIYSNVAASLPDWIWSPVEAGAFFGGQTREAIVEGKSIMDVLMEALQPITDLINTVTNLINLAFNFMFDIVPRLVRIGYNVVISLFNNIGAFFDLVLQLFQSYNTAEPKAIAGVMQCAVNPKENPVCIMLWVLEHTVFSGRGYLLIPFAVVYWTVLLVIWTVQRVSVKLRTSAGSV